MADWEWRRASRGGDKALSFESVLPPLAGGWGGSFVRDNSTPVIRREFRTTPAPQSVADAVESAWLSPHGTYTILGFTGYVESWSSEDIDGTNRCYVSCTLSKPTVDLSS